MNTKISGGLSIGLFSLRAGGIPMHLAKVKFPPEPCPYFFERGHMNRLTELVKEGWEEKVRDEYYDAFDKMNFHLQEMKKYDQIRLDKYQEWCKITGKVVE